MSKPTFSLNRREYLKRAVQASAGLTAMLAAPSLFSAGHSSGHITAGVVPHPSILSFRLQIAELCELIIPTTETPGAKEAGVPAFIEMMLTNWHRDSEREDILHMLGELDRTAEKVGGTNFLSSDLKLRQSIAAKTDASNNPAFAAFKAMTVFGYYTSKAGSVELDYTPVPGRYQPCIPMDENTRASLIQGIG